MDRGVLMWTDRICIKYGPHVHLSEAATMRSTSQNSAVPVPQVFCAVTHQGCTYIVMERVRGQMIGAGWVARKDGSKTKLLAHLRGLLLQM